MDWIIANKEWLFSGICVAVPLALLGWLLRKRAGRAQTQRSGDHSLNIQAGSDVNVGGPVSNDRSETNKRR